MGGMTSFDCGDGSSAEGHLAKSPGARAGVVVLQEWWGLNDQIKGIAERLAGEGYRALAPNLYDARVTQEPDEAGHMMEGLDWVGATRVEARGAIAALKRDVDRVCVMGFCMGGALTVIACANLPECDGGICFYGIPPKEQADPADIAAPFQGHFGNSDDWCTPAVVNELEAVLNGIPAPSEIYRYDAEHAFFNEQSEVFDAAAAALSWERSLDFLKRHF